MLLKDLYRQVFEMGQEGQEKPESVSSMISPGNFPNSRALYAPKGTKGMNFQEFHNFMIRKSVQNFLPFVPLRVGWGIQGTKDRNFPMKEDIAKVTKLNAPNAPTFQGVI